MKRKSSASEIAKLVGVSSARGMEAVIKAQLPRSAVTGILSGSLQKVTIDRVLKIIEAVGLTAEIRVKNSTA